jgi:hypothetical protein
MATLISYILYPLFSSSSVHNILILYASVLIPVSRKPDKLDAVSDLPYNISSFLSCVLSLTSSLSSENGLLSNSAGHKSREEGEKNGRQSSLPEQREQYACRGFICHSPFLFMPDLLMKAMEAR